MKKFITYPIIALLLTSCGHNKLSDNGSDELGDYQLVWFDEFDYTGLPDSSKWSYDTEGNGAGWGNYEAQYYTVKDIDNARVENGILHITAIKEKFGDKAYTSVRLNSNAYWETGRIEVSAKIPTAAGTWSAIWMMPGNWSFNDGGWPDVGEIDIMEHVGHNLGVVHASAHCKDYQWQAGNQKTAIMDVEHINTKFHTYTLDWTDEEMKISVDDSTYFSYKNEGLGESKWPYNKPFYLILNLAVGGAWGGIVDNLSFPQTMEVDYVRVYQRKKLIN